MFLVEFMGGMKGTDVSPSLELVRERKRLGDKFWGTSELAYATSYTRIQDLIGIDSELIRSFRKES